MDVNDLIQILENNQEQLTHILNDCEEGSSELVLLASKMGPILENFSLLESELSSSISSTEAPTGTETEKDLTPQE